MNPEAASLPLDHSPLLERLLWPLPLDAFLEGYWEQAPLTLLRQQPDYYRSLLDLPEGDSLQCLLNPADGRTDSGWVLESGLDGHSSFFHHLQKRSPSLESFCRRLMVELAHPIDAELVVSPPDWQGLPYAEDCDLLLLQIDGRKRWTVYPPVTPLPLSQDVAPIRKAALRVSPLQQAELGAGDLLYVPRGHILVPATDHCQSLHLGLRISVRRWADLLEQALEAAAQDHPLGQALPGRGVWSASNSQNLCFAPLLEHLSAAIRRLQPPSGGL